MCFLVIGTGLPLLGKNTGTVHPTPSTSSRPGTNVIPSRSATPTSPVAEAKGQIHEKPDVVLTSDRVRGAVATSPAAKPNSSTAGPVHMAVKPSQKRAGAGSPVARNAPTTPEAGEPGRAGSIPVRTGVESIRTASGPLVTESAPATARGRLARVTAYWAGEGDYYTGRCISATGVRLHDGHCAVDPSIIPYGSVVDIAGVGKFLAVDTGSAVISRTAAREGGHTSAERNAIVVDLFFEERADGERFAASAAKYVAITWWTPSSTTMQAQAARSLFAEEDWTKIQGKQL